MNTSPKSEYKKGAVIVGGISLVVLLSISAYFVLGNTEIPEVSSIKKGVVISDIGENPSFQKKAQKNTLHKKTPDQVKVGYMTSWVAGTPSIRDPLIDFFETSEFNSIIIDIKDDTGKISYQGSNPEIEALGSYENRIPEIASLIEDLHKKGFYVIGRVAVFQDPHLTGIWKDQAVQNSSGGVWKDRKGLSWMDASSQKVWDYVISIAKESYDLGFDEINFDYIRFPTDGSGDMIFPLSGEKEMSTVINSFFAYLEKELETEDYKDMVRSADLFGLTTSASDDLGIGQILEDAVAHFDYVAPMTYPSHYGPGFAGLQNPNSNPGLIIAQAMEDAKNKLENHISNELMEYSAQFLVGETKEVLIDGVITEVSGTKLREGAQKKIDKKEKELRELYSFQKIRPWLQDFDYGGDYGYAEVRAQIDAVYASGLDSWMMWDPANKYTRSAYLK